MASGSPSAPARPLYLLIGEDPYRARLRLAELVRALASARSTASAGIEHWASPDLGTPLGVTRHDARTDALATIVMSGRSQGLFAALDERLVVIVEHAEALADASLVAEFPDDAALVLVTYERLATARPRRGRARIEAAPQDLTSAVRAAGGTVERIARLFPQEVAAWVLARARLRGVELTPAAVGELSAAVGTDSERVDHELAKLAAYASGGRVEDADVRALVPGAIEGDVFRLTEAVVRRNARLALATLERLLADGQAPQQIIAMLVWQFRVLLFASAMRTREDAERMAKAIRASSPNALLRWQAEARRVDQRLVTRAYEALYATDLAIKQGRVPRDQEGLALTLCVLDLCGVASADPRELVVGEPPRR